MTKHWFHQDDALKAREYRTENYDGADNLFTLKDLLWNYTSQDGYFITQLDEQDHYTYYGTAAAPRITNITYLYDNFGNVIAKDNLGDSESQEDEFFEYFI